MTQQEIIHQLVPLHFSDFDAGGIDRPSHTGIKAREELTFIAKPQQSLLGA